MILNFNPSANIFEVTITRTRPNTSIAWFNDALMNSTGEILDPSYSNTLISFTSTSNNNLIRTNIKQSDKSEVLQSYINDLNNTNSPHYGITYYCNVNNITTTISEIREIVNPGIENPDYTSNTSTVVN